TNPDFTKVWIDAEITFKKAASAAAVTKPDGISPGDPGAVYATKDANFVIGMLKAANCGVISVKPQDTLEKAITLMLANDFSQLAVMSNDRQLNGVISWKTVGKHLAYKNKLDEVKDAMESAVAVEDTEGLFR